MMFKTTTEFTLMHICHVNLASGYHGGENQTLQLIKQQKKMGYELTVVANPKSPFSIAAKELGCHVILASSFAHAHKRSITAGCQLIHVHEGKAIYWAWLQNKLFNIPYIITRRIDNRLKKKWLANMAYQRASAVVGLSSEIVSRITDAYPKTNVYKIPSSPVTYSVDITKKITLKNQYKDKFLVIHAANMVPHKAFNITVDAAKLLYKSHPDIHICLLGDGPERADLEAQAKGLSNLSFEGKQSSMGEWFAVAKLQVHPSYTEGLGSVILEGISAGLPVIGTDTGGIPDIIEHEKTGLLIPIRNAESLADAIVRLKTDRILYQEIITNSKQKIKQFDIAHTALLYEKLYQQSC